MELEKIFDTTEKAEEGMTPEECSKLIEYLEKQGWSAEQILDLFKYIGK